MSDNNLHNTPLDAEEPKETSPLEAFVEHQRRALDLTGKAIESLLPPAFVSNSKEAGKEFAAGFKVLADAAITELEKVAKKTEKTSDDDDRPSTTGRSKVKVQVD